MTSKSYGYLQEVPINGAAVTIPLDYIGIHAHKFPTNPSTPSAPDPAPGFRYGSFRCHDGGQGKFFWSRLNPTNGTYAWTDLDDYVNYYSGLGKSVWFTLVSTPTWAATTATLDPYGIAGGGSPATSQTHVSTFVTALVTRYLSKIKWLEIWNEPNYVGGSFWEGTAAQLVTVANTVRVAAKAVDPSILVMAPGLNHVTTMDSFLAAQDSVSLKYGYECIDGLAFHPYEATASIFDATNRDVAPPRIERARFAMNKVRLPSMPLYVSEAGISGNVADQAVIDFYALTPAARKARTARILAIYAARGAQTYFMYSYGGTPLGLCGDMLSDAQGVVAGIDEFYDACGKTFAAGAITQNRTTGVVTMTATTGRVFSW